MMVSDVYTLLVWKASGILVGAISLYFVTSAVLDRQVRKNVAKTQEILDRNWERRNDK